MRWMTACSLMIVSVACGPDATGGSGATGGETTTGSTGSGSDESVSGDSVTGESAGSGTGGGEIGLACGSPPVGAVEAAYVHTVTVSGGVAPYSFGASGLPDGLFIDPGTGEITGRPTEDGTFDVDVAVHDGAMGMGVTTCTLFINEKLRIEPFEEFPCVQRGEDARDHVAAGSGDEGPITCATPQPLGSGHGEIPEGVEVSDCQIGGAPTGEAAERHGTWAWLVQMEQSGVTRQVPFCYTQPNPTGNHAIRVLRDGDLVTDTVLVPASGTYLEDAPFAFGTADVDDPRFEISHQPSCAQNACFFGVAEQATLSPFAPATLDLDPQTPLDDANGRTVGFSHGLQASGTSVPAQLAGGPFILSLHLTYCIADNEGGPAADDGPCEGPANIQANAGGRLEYAIIMFPEQ